MVTQPTTDAATRRIDVRTDLVSKPGTIRGMNPSVEFVLSNGDVIRVRHGGNHVVVENVGRKTKQCVAIEPVATNSVRINTAF